MSNLILWFREGIKKVPFYKYSWILVVTIAILTLIAYFKLQNGTVFSYAIGVLFITFLGSVFAALATMKDKVLRIAFYIFAWALALTLSATVLAFGSFVLTEMPRFYKRWFPDLSDSTIINVHKSNDSAKQILHENMSEPKQKKSLTKASAPTTFESNTHDSDISVKFYSDFRNIDYGKLHADGWKVLDVNAQYLEKGLKNKNALELYTLPGDYWIMNSKNMKRYVYNTFALGIPSGNFKAEVSISSIDFECPNEQAGILLLSDTIDPVNNLRFTIIKNTKINGHIFLAFQLVISKEKEGSNYWGQSFNDILEKTVELPANSIAYSLPKIDKVWLRVSKYRGHYVFDYKVGGSDRPFENAFVYIAELQAQFICLAAFQGQVNGREKKIACDIDPVLFSNFSLCPNDKAEKYRLDDIIFR